MKKAIAIMAVASIAVTSFGALQVQWSGTQGFIRSDGATPIGTGLGLGDPVYTAQLLFSPSGTIGSPDDHNAWFDGAVNPNSDHEILQSVVIQHPGNDFVTLAAQNYVDTFESGFIFARVFDVGSDDTSNIQPGMWYHEGPMVATVQQTDPTVVQTYSINTGTSDPGVGLADTDELGFQVVPEPSVMALLGLGGLVFAIRRRFVS